jgi:P2-related tail formation protein
MARLTVQPSIDDVRSQALLTIIERLGALDLTPILVYRIDSVPNAALVLLAWQFDMLAPQWQLGAELGETIDTLTDIDALTDIDRLTSLYGEAGPSDYDSWRTLLKIAIPLHRTRGTPYAIKTALNSLGWTDVNFLEGQATWGGTAYPASQGWAVFRTLINLGAGQAVQAQDAERAANAINFFKPARAWLDSLWFAAPPIKDPAPPITDFVTTRYAQHDAAPTPSDLVTAPAWLLADRLTISPIYDGHFWHSGITYGASEPAIVDSGVIINGIAISTKG